MLSAVSALRAQLSWLVRGRRHTTAALDGLATDLRALQAKVADLDATVRALDAAQARLGDRQLDEFDRVRTAVAAATDDLMARVTALADRIDDGRVGDTGNEEQR
jgi:uncharacterized protein (DUF3084 family)